MSRSCSDTDLNADLGYTSEEGLRPCQDPHHRRVGGRLTAKRVLLLGTSAALLLIGSVASPLPTSAQPGAVTPAVYLIIAVPPPGSLYHGAYMGGPNGEEDDVGPAEFESYAQAVGKPPAWVYFSHNWFKGRDFPLQTARWIREKGSVPFIRLMLRSSEEQDAAEPTYMLQRILAGEFDADLRAWARSARGFGSALLVEYGTEVNGRWFSWNGVWNGGGATQGYGDPRSPDGPERFRDAYRRIVRLMREEGAHNVLWVFHVNNIDVPDEPWNRFEQYYPGDDYVDWVGVSAYGAQAPTDTETRQLREMMDGAHRRLAALSASKPIVLLEFGATKSHPTVDQARWAEQALRDLTSVRWSRLIGFAWWNEAWRNDNDPAHDTNMRVEDNPALARVFRQLVGGQAHVLGKPILVERVAGR